MSSAPKKSKLTETSFSALTRLFSALPAVDEDLAVGDYQAEFLGPWWFRNSAGIGVGLVGLPCWKGKQIQGKGRAVNLLGKIGALKPAVPMNVAVQVSRIDGNAALVLTYPSGSPFLLGYFIDELRHLDENTIMAITIVNLPLIRNLPMPFLLHRQP